MVPPSNATPNGVRPVGGSVSRKELLQFIESTVERKVAAALKATTPNPMNQEADSKVNSTSLKASTMLKP